MFNFRWRTKGDITDPAQFRALFSKDEVSALYGRFGTARKQKEDADAVFNAVRGFPISVVYYRII